MFQLNDTAHCVEYILDLLYELHLTQNWVCFEHYIKIINYFEKWFDYLEANCLRKFKNDIQILLSLAFLELLIEPCTIFFVYNQ